MDMYVYELLDKKQTDDVKFLIDKRKKYEQSLLQFPYGDEDSSFVLIYDKDELIFCMALSLICVGSYELIFFSHPDENTEELFRLALKRLKIYAKESFDISFDKVLLLTDTASGDELAKSLEFPLFNKEFYLYYDYEDFKLYDNKIYSDISFDFGDFATYHISDERKGYKNFLKFNISEFSENTVYLYGFYVKERYRNKKNAKNAFPYILRLLYKKGIRKILLQVSGSNSAALNLYKVCGFKIYQEITYYIVKD